MCVGPLSNNCYELVGSVNTRLGTGQCNPAKCKNANPKVGVLLRPGAGNALKEPAG